jgi:hypothetical protein
MAPRWPCPESGRQLARRLGQLLDDRLHLTAQRVGSEVQRADHDQHHEAGARHPVNPDPFQPANEWIEHVGDKNPKHQRDQKSLRPIQYEDHGDRGHDHQRQTLRINGEPGNAQRRLGVRT